jgi:hypothetical protein
VGRARNNWRDMNQLDWCSARLSVTVIKVRTLTDEQGPDRTTTRGRPLARVGLALIALTLPLLATDRGRALLAGVLPQYLHPAVRPRALNEGERGGPALPAGPG